MKNNSLEIIQTKNETILKFAAPTILTNGSYEFNNVDEAVNSPLAQQLFYLPFVKRVLISTNFIAIERFSIIEWKDVQEEVKEQIENYLNSGGIVINEPKEEIKKIPVEIYAESTPNPSVIKFVANKMLVEVDYEFKNKGEAENTPLAKELFKFPYVKEVFISQNYIAIVKTESVEWLEITNDLRNFIRNYITNGNEIISKETEQIKSAAIIEESQVEMSEISQQIISILDEYVKPAVAADGGNIAFQSFNETTKTVNVILQGACNGCPSSTITLKNGIENMLKQLLPDKIEQVVALNN